MTESTPVGPAADDGQNAESRRRLWGSREYRAWFASDSLSQIGTFVGGFAFTLLGFHVTGDVLLAGVVGSIAALAQCLALLPGGVLIDRVDRRRLLLVSGAVAAAVWAMTAALLLTGAMTAAVLMVLAAASGLVTGALENLSDAMLPQVVPGDLLPAATAANEGRDAGLQLGAAPLSGLLFGVHPVLPFVVSAVARVGQFFAALSLRGDYAAERGLDGTRRWTAGIRWLIRWGQPRTLVLLVAGVNVALAMCGTAIILSQQARGTAAWQIGLIQTFQGVGVLLGAVLLMGVMPRLSGAWIIRCAVVAMGIAVGAAAFTQDMWTIAVIGLLASLPIIPLNAVQGAYVSLLIPNRLRGRVLAATALVTAVLAAPASALAGILLELFGYPAAIVTAAAILLGVGAIAICSRSVGSVPRASDFDDCVPLEETGTKADPS
ncbi:MFS transporter [Microbacterium sp. GCS4]|uniref:MFS transporter n=1 Tax=Microbacterium sp. GCS4 TaxID=1692239 RepID=UPI0013791D72|nr:MFS transporter [Microbacterium sp. GCS4]